MFDNLLMFCGVLYIVRLSLHWGIQIYRGVNSYLLPSLFDRQGDFRSRFGQWALVTGCTGGIGREYAVQLARKGMDLVLVSRSEEKLETLANEIQKETGVKTLVVVADMTNTEVLSEVVSKVEGLDLGILVNNVGMLVGNLPMPFLEQDRDELVSMVTVNCIPATYLCHALLPGMKMRRRGAIINISSFVSQAEIPNFSVYCATKHFIHAFTKSIALESIGSGVIIQEVGPGGVRTAMTQYVNPTVESQFLPPADKFVSSALATLGHTSRTCGWWAHSAQWKIMEIFPEIIRDILLVKVGERAYTEGSAVKEMKKQK